MANNPPAESAASRKDRKYDHRQDDRYERDVTLRAKERNQRLFVDGSTGTSALENVGFGPSTDVDRQVNNGQ